jgi:hypothetical protein
MRASQFEFEKRFWIICAIYLAGFCLSEFDHVSFIAALRHSIAPSIGGGEPQAAMFARAVIAGGALFVFVGAALRTWGSGVFANGRCARYCPAFRRAGSRWTVSLHAESTLSGQLADGSWNRCYGKPIGICVSVGRELDFCLSADFSRRGISPEKSG